MGWDIGVYKGAPGGAHELVHVCRYQRIWVEDPFEDPTIAPDRTWYPDVAFVPNWLALRAALNRYLARPDARDVYSELRAVVDGVISDGTPHYLQIG